MTTPPPPFPPYQPPPGHQPPPPQWSGAPGQPYPHQGGYFPPQPGWQPPKKNNTLRNVLLAILAVFMFFVVVGACGALLSDGNSSSSSSAGGGDADEPNAPQQIVQVDATTLLTEFEGNEVQADAKYKGKTLAVTGVVAEVRAETFDDEAYVLEMGKGSDFELITVDCYGIAADRLKTVNIGDTVTMVGDFNDGGGGLSVRLDNCSLK